MWNRNINRTLPVLIADVLAIGGSLVGAYLLRFDFFITGEYLQNMLKLAGYSIVQTPEMKTGFTCEYGHNDGQILGIRCDMDGLLVQEISDTNYKSKNDGVMHACGHDAHMTIVTSLALYIMDTKPEIDGKIRFIFPSYCFRYK